jgi:GNAT superfamily N-acetyltransferase
VSRARVHVIDLADRADLVDVVARWVHEEWGALRGRSYEGTRLRFAGRAARGALPLSKVALLDGAPAGVASLRASDTLDYLPGATPWLCNVFVAPAYRGSGAASSLCRSLEAAASSIGFDRIFLATTVREGSLYHRLGYREVSTFRDGDEEVYILRKAPSP